MLGWLLNALETVETDIFSCFARSVMEAFSRATAVRNRNEEKILKNCLHKILRKQFFKFTQYCVAFALLLKGQYLLVSKLQEFFAAAGVTGLAFRLASLSAACSYGNGCGV